ncbi:MAG: acyltransferase [Oscillospiraceae bacterium]|nr:acyltransferase [Oscillospiraceae bacterium]
MHDAPISKYRAQIMGFSAVLIMLFHFITCVYKDLHIPVVTDILSRGNIGVDCFLFLSGIGLYRSMSKDGKALPFYKRRISRIVLPVLLISLPYWLARDFLYKHDGIGMFLLNWTTLSFWTHNNRTVWYVSLLLLLYPLYPLIYRMQKKHTVSIVILTVAVFAAVAAAFRVVPAFYDTYEIAITRIPVFLIGSLTGEILFSGQPEAKRYKPAAVVYTVLTVLLFGSALVLLKTHPDFDAIMLFYRLGSGGAGILLTLFSARLLDLCRSSKLHGSLKKLGALSLELYLIQIFIMNTMKTLRIGAKSGNGIRLLLIACAITVSVLITLFAGLIETKLRSRRTEQQKAE